MPEQRDYRKEIFEALDRLDDLHREMQGVKLLTDLGPGMVAEATRTLEIVMGIAKEIRDGARLGNPEMVALAGEVSLRLRDSMACLLRSFEVFSTIRDQFLGSIDSNTPTLPRA